MRRHIAALALLACTAAPLAARDSLGVFGQWGAFRDAEVPRCYAIAMAEDESEGFATVSTWPQRQVRGQVHFRLSRTLGEDVPLVLRIRGENFELMGDARNGWAADAQMDAAIVAAMRAASQMQIRARDEGGRRFTNTFDLSGAATAIDAATVACSQRN
ncbi:hypothetical protein [Alteraurantiacibacter aquimixticola]|uniref:Invasion associated locus B family protein n=1 Tax=Alteraurantiacibacter aquimixticola TaxID=2489173 RepID=A0A4T3F245_9SPHN|nr:hypothetical protein [Alteraurantiacibacter aquimixticola]TIX50365.1 hypothetical protein E5222_08795 [Alteraurantiacibacter aquimixticola]